MLPSDFLFYRKSRIFIARSARVIGLLDRGDTPPTAGIPTNSTPHTPHPQCTVHSASPWGYGAFGGIGYWATSVLCYSGSPWGYAAYGGHP